MESERSKRIPELIERVGGTLTDVVMWPESEAAKETAEAQVKLLRLAFKEEGAPVGHQMLVVGFIVPIIYNNTVVRKNKTGKTLSFKQAWAVLAEALP